MEPARAEIEFIMAETDESEAFLKGFLGGELGRKLGLSTEQLRVGLAVAQNHIARGAYSEAFRMYMSLVLCDPMHVDFQVGLAQSAALLGEHHVAIQAASAVIALAPRDPRGYLLCGRSCFAISSYPEAHEDLSEALRLARETGDEALAREADALIQRVAAASGSMG